MKKLLDLMHQMELKSWRSQKFKNRGLTNLILNDDKIYFGDFEGYIHELDAETGMITGLTKTNLKIYFSNR